jgi:hypothetical protein
MKANPAADDSTSPSMNRRSAFRRVGAWSEGSGLLALLAAAVGCSRVSTIRLGPPAGVEQAHAMEVVQ